MFGVDAVLVLLTCLHFGTALALWRIPPDRQRAQVQREAEPVWQAARDAFRQAPFLVNLAVLVLLGTMSAALLDYLFKSGAAAEFGKGPALTRYFAAVLHRESGVDLRGPGLSDPDCPAPAWSGKDRPVASRGRGVRLHRIAARAQGGYGSAGSRTGIGAARFVPSLRIRVVFHARASA